MCNFHRDGKLYIFTKPNRLRAFRPAKEGYWARIDEIVNIENNQQIIGCYAIFEWIKAGETILEMKEVMEDITDEISLCVIHDLDLKSESD
jgi:SOS-response transcriptional repressor LexA